MGKQSLKLFGTHAVISIFIFLFATMIISGAKSQFLHWLFTVLYLAMFWSVTWVSIVNEGNKDLKREQFAPWKGFAIGALVQAPALIAYLLLMFSGNSAAELITMLLLKGWFSPYLKFMIMEGWRDAYLVLFALLFIPVMGVGYLFGRKRREKTLRIIEERESRRGELSKRDSE
jgi:hypothetical protein